MLISAPIPASRYFEIDESVLHEVGAFDANVNVDNNLFVDPLLMAKTRNRYFGLSAFETLHGNIEKVCQDLKTGSITKASAFFCFDEFPYNALGYSNSDINRGGRSPALNTAYIEAIKVLSSDSSLSPLASLIVPRFMSGVSKDRLGDFSGRMLLEEYNAYNRMIAEISDLETFEYKPLGADETQTVVGFKTEFAEFPFLFTPKWVLRDMEPVRDWDGIVKSIDGGSALRESMFAFIKAIRASKGRSPESVLNQMKEYGLLNKGRLKKTLDLLIPQLETAETKAAQDARRARAGYDTWVNVPYGAGSLPDASDNSVNIATQFAYAQVGQALSYMRNLDCFYSVHHNSICNVILESVHMIISSFIRVGLPGFSVKREKDGNTLYIIDSSGAIRRICYLDVSRDWGDENVNDMPAESLVMSEKDRLGLELADWISIEAPHRPGYWSKDLIIPEICEDIPLRKWFCGPIESDR